MDFFSNGKRAGFIDTTHSDNALAFSTIRTPIGVIVGGDGPTIMLSAGNHGDEYEGQIILHRLMERLSPEQISGRLIILPALNTPAVGAKSRISPIDQNNMNRSFPGAKDQGPTKAITGFVTQHILSLKGQRVNKIKLAEDGETVVIHCSRDARRSAIDPATGKKGSINQHIRRRVKPTALAGRACGTGVIVMNYGWGVNVAAIRFGAASTTRCGL